MSRLEGWVNGIGFILLVPGMPLWAWGLLWLVESIRATLG